MTALKRAIELRKQVSKSSTAKLDSLLLRTSSDGRLRQNYKYYGAHTGRWSGEGVQPQNLPRGTVKEQDFEAAVSAVRSGADLSPYGPTLDVISSTLRGAFKAPEGYTFLIVDLSQIEVRVLAWLSQCKGLLDVYRLKHPSSCSCGECDVYISFARRMYKAREIAKHQRQISKSAVLGCGFQLSGGKEVEDDNGDLIKTGLWGYALNMGIEMTQEEAHDAVKMYREEYWEVKKFWSRIEDACKIALQGKMTTPCGFVSAGAVERLLWINLPAGRPLYYPKAKLRDSQWPDGRPKTEIRYYAVDPETKQFKSKATYGGKLTENLCQAIARDVLAEGMLRIDDGYSEEIPIVGHTHDEVICLSEKAKAETNLEIVSNALTTPMPWALDLPLGASGAISDIYRK